MAENNTSMEELPDLLYPKHCRAIECPEFAEEKCKRCRLKEMLSEKEGYEDVPVPEYNPDGIPCPLGEFSDITYRDWLDMSKHVFKRAADKVILLLVEEYRQGKMTRPQDIWIRNIENGEITYNVTYDTDPGCTYNKVASAIYENMGMMVTKAQIRQSRYTEEQTSVTMSLAYLAAARVSFLNEVKSLCDGRYTDEDLEELVRDKAERWKTREERLRREEEERKRREEEFIKTVKEQCTKANVKYGTDFYFSEKTGKVYFSRTGYDEEEFEKRLACIAERLEAISSADWIALKTYRSAQTVFNCCPSFVDFKKDFTCLWNSRSRETSAFGNISTTARMFAYVGKFYEEFTIITENYREFLEGTEEERAERFEDPLPIIDREKLYK